MNAHRFPHRRWIAGFSALIFTCTASPLVAQVYGAYGYGSANPPQTYAGQPDVAPPPPDVEDNAPYGNPPYANTPAPYPGNYPPAGMENGAENYPPSGTPGYGAANPNLSEPAQALDEGQLEQLLAPVALYPDTLLAEILAAATWPQQIIEADQWRQAQGNAPPEAIAAGADAQNWDPSVKALTAFPQVLQQMDQNLQWATELGNAYYNEPDAVLGAVQSLRQRAQASGTLASSPQETVSDDDGYVQLAPPNPNVMYVPAYNPWTAYGQPIAPYPGYSLLDAVGDVLGPALQYGIGTVLSAFSPFSWLSWGLNWLTGCLFFHGSGWYPNNYALADWGLPYGGPRWDWRRGGGYGWDREYGHGWDRGYGRGDGRYGQGYGRGYGGGYRDGSRGSFGFARGNGVDQRGIYHGPARPVGNGFGGRQIAGVRGHYEVSGGYGGRGTEYGRGQQAWNRMPSLSGRSGYGRGSYGAGYTGSEGSSFRGAGVTYGSRPGTPTRGLGNGFRGGSYGARDGAMGFRGGGFAGSAPTYRSPTIARSFGGSRGGFGGGYRSGFGGGSSRSFSGRGFSGYGGSSHSGGFRSFGGGHASRGFSGGSHFGGGRHFSGGSHFSSHGGGHSHGGGGHRR